MICVIQFRKTNQTEKLNKLMNKKIRKVILLYIDADVIKIIVDDGTCIM